MERSIPDHATITPAGVRAICELTQTLENLSEDGGPFAPSYRVLYEVAFVGLQGITAHDRIRIMQHYRNPPVVRITSEERRAQNPGTPTVQLTHEQAQQDPPEGLFWREVTP